MQEEGNMMIKWSKKWQNGETRPIWTYFGSSLDGQLTNSVQRGVDRILNIGVNQGMCGIFQWFQAKNGQNY